MPCDGDRAIPQPPDRLICLRNNYFLGLFNGSTWVTRAASAGTEDSILLTIVSDDTPNSIIQTTSHLSFFRGTADDEMSYLEQLDFDPFDFAYAITVHKAQGSQWDHIVLFDESKCFKRDQHCWLYTGITRAAKRITVVLL